MAKARTNTVFALSHRSQPIRLSAALAILATSLFALPSSAMDFDGFSTPTGNIYCLFHPATDGLAAGIRCGITKMTRNMLPAKPADCDLDWGDVWLGADAGMAEGVCAGDTVAGDYPTLEYGQSFQRGRIRCLVSRAGLQCRNAFGNGFELSRAKQRLF